MNQRAKIDIRHSTCPHDCPSACALDIEVIDNSTIGRVRGSKLQTYTAGVVCAKVAPLRRAHPPSGSADLSAPPHRPEGVGPIRAHFMGRSAGRDRGAVRRGRARFRGGVGVALLLCRHHGPRHARRHQPSRPCEKIFPVLPDDMRQHRAGRVCHRHRQDRRRRSARNGRLRPDRDLGHQSGEYPGQRDDPCGPRAQGARRQDRGGRYLQQRHHEAGRYQDHPAPRHRRRLCLRRHACAVPRRLCRSRLSRALYRLSGRTRGASCDPHAGMGFIDLRRAGRGDRGALPARSGRPSARSSATATALPAAATVPRRCTRRCAFRP